MCFPIEKIKPFCFSFDRSHYLKEAKKMRKSINKIKKDIENENKQL